MNGRQIGDVAMLPEPPRTVPAERLRVLLVEDDAGDAFLVQELLAEARVPIDLETAVDMASAKPRIASVHCVLLDLGLPDASGLDGLRAVLRESRNVAVCVLTGLEDEHLGIAAVGAGAQDYLVKGQVDGVLLGRALRYAVERKRADDNAQRLREVELHQAESARLERGLLPKPVMLGDKPAICPFYRPGRHRALLGGDFFDAVQTAPGVLHLLIGDVCGHGVDEAPLGVALRVAWRALILADVPDAAVLPALDAVLMSERRSDELFATVATVTLDLAARQASMRLAGHPPPLILTPSTVELCDVEPGLVLGVLPGADRPAATFALPPLDWTLLLYTDGLIEGWAAPDSSERLGLDGLCGMLGGAARAPIRDADLPTWLVGRVEERNGGPLADDVAVLLITPEAAA